MKCPICKEPDLIMAERQSIEIDYCPQCRGVWLDRGELDKIIDRATVAASETAPAPRPANPVPNPAPSPSYQQPQQHQFGNRYGKDDDYRQGYPHKKRKGFLSDLFDFD